MKTSTTPALINVSMTAEELRTICADIAGDIQGSLPGLLVDDAATLRNLKGIAKRWRAHSPLYVSKRQGVPHEQDTKQYREYYDWATDLLERLTSQLEEATARKKLAA